MENKSFLDRLGQADPWCVFWVMWFGTSIIESVCNMIVALVK